MKEKLHKKYGWYECMFNPLDVYQQIIICQWCGKKYRASGYPYINLKLNEQTKLGKK